MQHHLWTGSLPAVVLGLLLTAVGGCSSTTFKVRSEQAPTQHYQAIAIPHVEGKFAEGFRNGLVERLRALESFAQVLDPAPGTLPSGTVLIHGGLSMDPGGYVLVMETSAYVEGHFDLNDDKGVLLAQFSVKRESGERSRPVDDAELVAMFRELGYAAADALSRWMRGGRLAS